MSDLAMLQLRAGYLAFAQDWSAQIAKNVLTGAEVADYVTDKSSFQVSFKIDQGLRPPEGYKPHVVRPALEQAVRLLSWYIGEIKP